MAGGKFTTTSNNAEGFVVISENSDQYDQEEEGDEYDVLTCIENPANP